MNQHADSRAITYAVAASLALHALLLVLRAPESQPAISPGAPIVAHLAEPEAVPAAPPPAPAPLEPPKPQPKREVRKPLPPVVQPAPAPQPRVFSVPIPAEPTPEAVPQPEAAAAPAPAPAPTVSPPGPVASAPPAPAAPDPATLIAQYRSQLIATAARYKRYPLPARDNGWEGDVVVQLEVAPNGELSALQVKRSSGHSVLDQQALEMFRLAAPQVPVPAQLRGRAFTFDVRAVYSLKE